MVVEVSGGRAVQEPLVALAALLASVVSALLPGLATGARAPKCGMAGPAPRPVTCSATISFTAHPRGARGGHHAPASMRCTLAACRQAQHTQRSMAPPPAMWHTAGLCAF